MIMKLYDLLFEYASYESMVNKLQSIYILMSRGATDGERSASKSAYDRILGSINREYGEAQAAAAEKKVKGNGQSGDTSGSSRSYTRRDPPKEPPKREKPQDPPKQKNYDSSSPYTDPRSGWTFYIVRNVDPFAGKNGSNKIWGYATRNDQVISFWGGYGKTVQTKPLSSEREASIMIIKKARKGYRNVNLIHNTIDYSYIFNQFLGI